MSVSLLLQHDIDFLNGELIRTNHVCPRTLQLKLQLEAYASGLTELYVCGLRRL